jgi:hypothetical protein
MIPKNRSRPSQMKAKLFSRVMIPDSEEERIWVRSVAGIIRSGSGASE